ncbi:MAG: nitroreductase/quinone reductase family protein [Chloroflexota bacterium]
MFGFMNHVVNPIIIFLLRGPFRKSWGAGMLVLTYHGRKSGKAYSLPVNYFQDGGDIIIIPGQPEAKKWWRNIRGGANVSVSLRGEEKSGQAQLWEAPGQLDLISSALLKQVTKFPNFAPMYGVKTGDNKVITSDAVRKAAETLVVVKITLG